MVKGLSDEERIAAMLVIAFEGMRDEPKHFDIWQWALDFAVELKRLWQPDK